MSERYRGLRLVLEMAAACVASRQYHLTLWLLLAARKAIAVPKLPPPKTQTCCGCCFGSWWISLSKAAAWADMVMRRRLALRASLAPLLSCGKRRLSTLGFSILRRVYIKHSPGSVSALEVRAQYPRTWFWLALVSYRPLE